MKKLILLILFFTGFNYAQTYYNLSSGSFTQNWTNTGLITVNDNWSGVQSIIGYLGSNITSATGANPSQLLGEDPTIDVIANQTIPKDNNSGGVAEFQITNPTIALQGSGTADAPNIVIFINSENVIDLKVSYSLRDIDDAADNAVQPVALQYRIGASGDYTNIAEGYVADATTGPSVATLVTSVNVNLPILCNNVSQLQIRIITANASGNDEWVGIDDISITGTTKPSTQSSDINLTNITNSSMTINWTNGSGAKRVVFINEGHATITLPTNKTTYTASNDWANKGSELGSGYYCVYNGDGNSVNLTNLVNGAEYTIYCFEYNGSSGGENYNDAVTGTYNLEALPVELSSFTATTAKNGVVLNWSTATELNNNCFEIERKIAENNWEKIGTVNGHGNSNSVKEYSYTDDKLSTAGTYSYRLKQVDNDGQFTYSDIIEVNVEAPNEFGLVQNYPNPFNPETTISYSIPQSSAVKLIVFNALGQEVMTLVNGYFEAGNHSVKFNASNLPSGVYFYQMQAGSFTSVKKMVLTK